MSKSQQKVGSDSKATHEVGGESDFGIPVQEAVKNAHNNDIEGRPAGSAPGNTGARGVRVTGVGSPDGGPGHGSGGDIDPDWIGLDGHGGLSAKPVHGHTDGPDDAANEFSVAASGKSESFSKFKSGAHGAGPAAQGDYVDHSGTDTSTMNPAAAGAVNPNKGEEPGAEGEITGDEASGNLSHGAET